MYGGTIPLEFAPRSYGEGVLLVGDAAGQVKPFSGGGIYTSLVAARNAARKLWGFIAVSGSRCTVPVSGAAARTARTYSSGCTRASCSSLTSGAS